MSVVLNIIHTQNNFPIAITKQHTNVKETEAAVTRAK